MRTVIMVMSAVMMMMTVMDQVFLPWLVSTYMVSAVTMMVMMVVMMVVMDKVSLPWLART